MKLKFNDGVSFSYGDFGLTAEQKTHLLLQLIKSDMTELESSEFLNAISTAIDEFKKNKLFEDKAIKAMNNLMAFSQSAHRLKLAIENLNNDNQDAFRIYSMYFSEFTTAANPAILLSDEMRDIKPPLGNVLEAMHETLIKFQNTLPELEKVADYTIEQLQDNLNNGKRLSDNEAKRLALAITKVYRNVFNKLPPFTRGSWFEAFMSELAKIVNPKIKLGARTLEYAHKKLKE
jgi:hypothetical protein